MQIHVFFCLHTHFLEHYLLLFYDRMLVFPAPLSAALNFCFTIAQFLFLLFLRCMCKPKSVAHTIIKLIWFHSDDSSGETESSQSRNPLRCCVIHRLSPPPPRAGVLINALTSRDPWRHGLKWRTCFSPQNTQTQQKFMLTESLFTLILGVIHDERACRLARRKRWSRYRVDRWRGSMRRFWKLNISPFPIHACGGAIALPWVICSIFAFLCLLPSFVNIRQGNSIELQSVMILSKTIIIVMAEHGVFWEKAISYFNVMT